MAVSEERYGVEEEFDSEGFEDVENPVEDEPVSVPSKPKTEQSAPWHVIRRFFFKTASEKVAERHARLAVLDRAIETYPDVAINYLLRGEIRLEIHDYDLAQQDLQTALELAEAQYENDRWGLGSQAIQDRARHGLQRIVR